MPQKTFDDPALRTRMAQFLAACERLDEASQLGSDPRDLLDLAEQKTLAEMALRKRLIDLGWSAPAAQRSST